MNGAQFAAMVAAKKGGKDPVPGNVVSNVLGKGKSKGKKHSAAVHRRIKKKHGKIYDPNGIPNDGDEYRIINGKKVPIKVGK